MNNSRRFNSRNKNQSTRNNEHDDRTVRFGSTHRGRGGGFKSRPPTKRGGYVTKRYDRHVTPRSRLDDDVDMDGDGTSAGPSRRYTPYARGRSSNSYRRGGSRPILGNTDYIRKELGGAVRDQLDKSEWYRVTIPHGKRSEKAVILKSLAEHMNNVPFVPFHYQHEGQNAIFYVQEQSTAQAIRNCNRRITAPTGHKLLIMVRASAPPYTQMTQEVIDKLKVVMSHRYDPANKSLNMSSLYTDDSLSQEGIHLILNKYPVMKEVLTIIESNIPELVSLDISLNKLYSLDSLKDLHKKTLSLTKISVGHNQLKTEHDLDAVKTLGIEELVLDGNPLCDKFKDEVSYVSALRKKFPKLVKLDGHDLPPVIKIDLESGVIPPTKGSNFGNEQVQQILSRFCQEYFTIYDTNDRQPLLSAYHDQALFTISFSFNSAVNDSRDNRQPLFKDYMENSRNLLRVPQMERRQHMLKRGKLSVVEALCRLPATEHDPASFVVDVSHVSASLLVFTVTGLFRERECKLSKKPVRYFARTFVAVPHGQGIVITNDMYIVSNASMAQQKKAFQSAPAVTPPLLASSPVGSNPVTPVASPAQVVPNDQMKAQMLAQFSQQSGMNVQWSQQCLEHNAWDYDKSAIVFTDLKTQGKVPPEAFVK